MRKLFSSTRTVTVFAETKEALDKQTGNSLSAGFRWLAPGLGLGILTSLWSEEKGFAYIEPTNYPQAPDRRWPLPSPGEGYNATGAPPTVTPAPVPVRAVLNTAELQGFLEQANDQETPDELRKTIWVLVLSNPVWVDLLLKSNIITVDDVLDKGPK